MAARPNPITRLVCILLLCSACTSLHAQDDEDKPEYKFDTSLSHGYSLVYKTDDSLQYLYLRHGKNMSQISWEYKENKQSMLGYIAYDFDKYFVLLRTLHVFRNEIPMDFELFEKETAKVVFKGYYIDAKDSVILLHNQRNMELYNIRTEKIESFDFPKLDNAFSDRLINMIRIKGITPHALTITYYKGPDNYDPAVKTYKR